MNIKIGPSQLLSLLLIQLSLHLTIAQVHKRQKSENVVAEMQVVCHSDSITLKMNTNTPFNGRVYARDVPNGENCVSEFNSSTNMTFRLPLKSCGTLFTEVDDGIEYFNTVVVQPHMRLMTNQGKGYHIRCKYQTRERTIANTQFNVSAAFAMQNNALAANAQLLATAAMPSCTMKIYRSSQGDVAEAVKIGDKLVMVIGIDEQNMYGMKITNCVVRDGLNKAEQQLIDDVGCPIDETIMPKFQYIKDYTEANVTFPAHKFPHTSSVYYQCNVRLCIKNGGCDHADCSANFSANSAGGPRRKRFAAHQERTTTNAKSPTSVGQSESKTKKLADEALPAPEALSMPANQGSKATGDMSFDVYSGLYVSDLDVGESGSSDANAIQVPSLRRSNGNDPNDVCLNMSQVGLLMLVSGLGAAGVVLMLVCQVGSFSRNPEVCPSASKILGASRYPRSSVYDNQECRQHTRHCHYEPEAMA